MEGGSYVSETIADDDGRRQWLFKFLSNSRSPTSGDKSWNADPKKDHPRADDHPDVEFGGRGSLTVQTFWSGEYFALCNLYACANFGRFELSVQTLPLCV